MGIVCKLVYGTREFDLNDGSNFIIMPDFAPPAADYALNMASGASANRYAGGEVVGVKAQDRAFSFGVRISGATSGDTHAQARRLQNFLDLAHDKSDTLYLIYKPNNSTTYEPLWGQFGACRRYTIKHGSLSIGGPYGIANTRERALFCTVSLTVGPFALGKPLQLLMRAKGGVVEDTVGTPDGRSRGLQVAETFQNKMTNPIYSHATWNNGWTAGADINASQNTVPQFTAFGANSAKITRIGAGGNKYFYQTVNVGNTNTHILSCYIIKPDKSAVTTDDFDLIYDVNPASNQAAIPVGNGWYRVYGTCTGIAGATGAGVGVKNIGDTLYVDGFDLVETDYLTAHIDGTQFGCAWDSTAHASSSTRAAPILLLPIAADTYSVTEGTAAIALRMQVASGFGADMYVFFQDTVDFYFGYDAGTNTWVLGEDAGNTASTAAQTWAINDKIVFHITWGPAGMFIYKNGAQAGASAGGAFVPPVGGSNLYFGSNHTGGSPLQGAFTYLEIYDHQMTAAEALADYNNVLSVVNDDLMVSPIPYSWTKDGDNIVDNCDDSTRDNWLICGGIPGNAPALTRWDIDVADETRWFIGGYARAYREYIPPGNWYADQQGSADATCSGGEYLSESISTGQALGSSNPTVTNPPEGALHYFVRMASAQNDLSLMPAYRPSTSAVAVEGEYKAITTDATFRIYYAGSLYYRRLKAVTDYASVVSDFYIQAKRSGGAANASTDFILVIPGKLMQLIAPTALTALCDQLLIEDRTAVTKDASNPHVLTVGVSGQVVDLEPGRYNTIWFIAGGHGQAHTIARTATFSRIYVTPRYSLV